MALGGKDKKAEDYQKQIQQLQNAQNSMYNQLAGSAGLLGGLVGVLGNHPLAQQYPGGLVPVDTPKRPPCLDLTKVEALKGVEPHKVHARMPDLVQVITAWRVWRVSDDRLWSLAASKAWEPKKKLEAECNNHRAPHKLCGCGVWGFSTLEKLNGALSGYKPTNVLGKVAMWGRVIECEHGYRAQFAYPTELWLLDKDLEELGYIYGVPVRTLV